MSGGTTPRRGDICRAIEQRRIVQFSYEGLPRVVEPYAHGESTAGHDVLRAYQIRGESDSDDLPDWRLFDTTNIEGFTVTDEQFSGQRESYTPDDPDIAELYCQR